MASNSLLKWQRERAAALDEIEAAHNAIGGSGRGRRYATQQVNQAYVMPLPAQFQGFCRDLHSECVDILVGIIHPTAAQGVLLTEFTLNRQLDRGNAAPSALGADFGRLGIEF